jgi:hypothetical protein
MVADFDLFGSHGQGTHTGAGHLLALDAQPFACAHMNAHNTVLIRWLFYIVSSFSYLLVVNGRPN